MAGTAGYAPDAVALERALQERPGDFDFFEAIRQLECAHPTRPRLGESTKPSEDFVRLCQTPSLAFAASAIDRFEPAGSERPARMHAWFFGLFGPNAPLPLHLTEYAIDRERNARDPTLIAFANIFHHRMASLFYRAWANTQPTVQADRGAQDRFRLYTGALVGMATPGLEGRDALPDDYKRHFAGRMVAQTRNAEGLRSLLQHFFVVPVRVIEFVAEWMRLPGEAHLRLGRSADVAVLGRTAVMGEYVWGAQQRFRLRLGPLRRDQFEHFLPGGTALAQLVATVRSYIGDEKAWDVQLVLAHDQVPAARLGRGGCLGLTTWLGQRPQRTDADEVVLKPVG
ncbi:type VI secretion system baseplate subunit TssG [Frateuria terrea]|uniref:Type VI secretion system protein ImpH n=1 Tax=Frateuria terrea TaxID=529704 RepID=A0A1H6QD22_9GAMM|nr:type VI secretion system baseplate subunit TssG [Frateuria terrea]SEI41619.1 type VI secretion system protein ImpH [Frateuria terrea]SFP06985.1 type VI secretion system protein ImpH [Frateuria terrea]